MTLREHWGHLWLINKVMIVVALLLVASSPFVAIHALMRSDQLFSECQADGHKEYECYAMLRSRR